MRVMMPDDRFGRDWLRLEQEVRETLAFLADDDLSAVEYETAVRAALNATLYVAGEILNAYAGTMARPNTLRVLPGGRVSKLVRSSAPLTCWPCWQGRCGVDVGPM